MKMRKLLNLVYQYFFNRVGHFVGTLFLAYNFLSILFVGQRLWVEPNKPMLMFEIVLSLTWLVVSIFEIFVYVLTFREKREGNEDHEKINCIRA